MRLVGDKMNKLFLNFSVNGMTLYRTNNPTLTEGSNKFIHAKFHFSKEWDGVDKYLLVSRANETYIILLVNDEAEIEYEAIRTSGRFEIGLVGNKGDVVITTNVLSISVNSTEFKDNPAGEETRLTNDFLIRTLAEIKANRDSVEQTVAELPTLINDYVAEHKEELKGDKGDKGEQGIQGIQGVAGKDGKDGVDGKDGKDGVIPTEDLAQIQQNTQAISQQSDDIVALQGKVTELENKELPIASASVLGIAKVNSNFGVISENGELRLQRAVNDQISNRNNGYRPIVPFNLDYAVKCAMCDGKGASWTDTEKASARERIGLGNYVPIFETTLNEEISSTNQRVRVVLPQEEYIDVKVEVLLPITSGAGHLYVHFYCGSNLGGEVRRGGIYPATRNNAKTFATFESVFTNGYRDVINNVYGSSPNLEHMNTSFVPVYKCSYEAGIDSKLKYVSSLVLIYSDMVIPIGTVIKVYGRN